MRTKTVLTVLTMALVLPLTARAASSSSNDTPNKKVAQTKQVMRNLWTNHIFWVRNVVIATHDGNSKAAKAAKAQVVENAKNIAGTIKPFYGESASKAMFKLLAGHWKAIDDYLNATDNSNKDEQRSAAKELYGNGKKIADFLHKANPDNWPKDALLGMLSAHAGLHIKQINEIYAGDYKQEAKTWAAFIKNVDGMADALVTGLAKQFPDKFK